jgi:hypothetical protein
MRSADDYQIEATRRVEAEIDRLRELSYVEATALPEVDAKDIVITDRNASLTTFRYEKPELLDGITLVVVLLARPQFLGMGSCHLERGLVFSPVASARPASTADLENLGG